VSAVLEPGRGGSPGGGGRPEESYEGFHGGSEQPRQRPKQRLPKSYGRRPELDGRLRGTGGTAAARRESGRRPGQRWSGRR
jgi:hypothetical protein